MTPRVPSTAPTINRKTVAAWCVFDWANSAFPAVITTFVFATYFTQNVARDPVTGTAQWGHALAIAGLTIAILSPLTGAIADRTGAQKRWLALFSALTCASMAALWFVLPSPDSVMLALIGITLATIGFEVACVFYNALLPAVAPQGHIGRVSGWGWGLGYIGGIVCLVIILFGFVLAATPLFGLDKSTAEHVRIAGPFSAIWYAVFAMPLFLLVPEPRVNAVPLGRAIREGMRDLWRTVRSLRQERGVAWFLLANMVYTDGLTTLFAFGGIYAAGTFGMTLDEVIMFGIALNLTAGIGGFGFAWIDDRIGARATIMIGLAALILIGGAMLVIESKATFWILGLLLGAFFGPVQAASRSLAAHLAPPEQRGQMFGLFALSGRVTAFVGPAVLGWATLIAGNQRAGMATILLFLAAGLALLWLKVENPERRA